MPIPELIAYISEQRENGISHEQIFSELLSIGWNDGEINEALNHVLCTSRKKKSFFGIFFKTVIVCFALVGIGLVGAYTAVRLKVTNTSGIIDTQANSFWQQADVLNAVTPQSVDAFFNNNNYCLLGVLKSDYSGEFRRVVNIALSGDTKLAGDTLNALGTTFDLNQKTRSEACREQIKTSSVAKTDFEKLADMIDSSSPFTWENSSDWEYFKTAVVKDKDVIGKVSKETGISSRIIVGELAAEQMRLFNSERSWFKSVIAPLKVLGSMTQFSWGVMGIKSETAQLVESNLADQGSAFYPGPEFEHMLDFTTKNKSQERFKRITSDQDHYYAYLYAALFDREIMAQWQRSSLDISNKPGVLATLFNIGFVHSKPNTNPQLGGASISVGGQQLSFGRLAYEFYYSDQLLDEFPLDSLAK